MKAIKELNDGGGRDNEEDDSMIGLIKAFAGGILPALTAGPPQPAPGQPAPEPGVAQKIKFDFYLKRLCKAAARDSDPQSYYDVILDELPEAEFVALRDAIAKEEVWMAIVQRPDVAQFAAWFEELRRMIVNGPQEEVNSEDAKAQNQEPKP